MATTTHTPIRTGSGLVTLARARRGDRDAFSRLMEPYRHELVAYCYRLTGALSEAEDLAQEAFVRAYRALETFQGRATPRAWLYRIAHNLCINHVQRRPPAWESLDDAELAGLAAGDAAAEAAGQEREDVRLSFSALVQSLPPRQRAALVLRDVLGWSAEEAARILETTVPAVKNALARARQTLARQPHGGDPANVPDLALADPAAHALVSAWVDAFEKGNTERMVALLTEQETRRAGLALPAGPHDFEQEIRDRSGYNKERSAQSYGEKTPRGPSRKRKERTNAQRQGAQRES